MRGGMQVLRHLPLVFPLVFLAAALPGCGGSEVEVQSQSEATPVTGGKEQIKARLSEIATTGSGGSAVSGIREALTELKATDEALANQLLRDLDRLETLSDPNQIKALAGSMADKL